MKALVIVMIVLTVSTSEALKFRRALLRAPVMLIVYKRLMGGKCICHDKINTKTDALA